MRDLHATSRSLDVSWLEKLGGRAGLDFEGDFSSEHFRQLLSAAV